jgi:outer membrane protein OmpA-like peptidoglycan-associated protein
LRHIFGGAWSKSGEEHNLKLSENRASSVYEKLVGMGIDTSRLSFKGLGSSKPVDTNDSEEGRANNRRTEFVIK